MNRSQSGWSVDDPKKRYFFAKPVLTRHRSTFSVKPVLLAQMQHFGYQRRFQEIYDVLAIGYLSSWFVRDIREFVLLRNCYPDFVISGENLCDTSQPSKRLIGAAARNAETTDDSGNITATIWVGDLSCWVRHGEAGTYDVFINLQLALQWIPKWTQVAICAFELKKTDTNSVVAYINRDTLEINQAECTANEQALVITTAVWTAHQESWLSAPA